MADFKVISFDKWGQALYGHDNSNLQWAKPFTHSGVNDYMPFVAGFTNLGALQNTAGDRVLLYGLPSIPTLPYRFDKRYDVLISTLQNYVAPKYFQVGDVNYHAAKGAIYEIVNGVAKIDMILALETSYLWDINKSEPDTSKFVLFVENRFMNAPESRNLVRRLSTDYFPLVSDAGIDIVHTPSIAKKCFNSTGATTFRTVAERNAHLQQLNFITLYE